MAKINDALKILKDLGVPSKQQNDRSALTILSLLNLKEDSSWNCSEQRMIGIHDIMIFIKDNYDRTYAENSRETFRRQTLHQFEQACLVIRNIDNPKRPTNSPKNNYAVTNEALDVFKCYGTNEYNSKLNTFLTNYGKLDEKYRKLKKSTNITVNIDVKNELFFTPGKHNQLQADIITFLKPRFFDDAILIYVGDCANKMLYSNDDLIKMLNIPFTQHDKLPDVIYYKEDKNILFLIEAVTSHGPVSPKRQNELEKTLNKCKLKRVYITAFPDVKEFKRHIDNIVWESEVWLADEPDHMIHYNGDKFLYTLED